MREMIIHFVFLKAQVTDPLVYGIIFLLFFGLLCASIMSLRSMEMGLGGKLAWLLVILLVPIFGLAAYCFYCLFKGDWSFFKFVFGAPRTKEGLSK